MIVDDVISLKQMIDTLNWVTQLPADDEVLGLRNREIIVCLTNEIAWKRLRILEGLK